MIYFYLSVERTGICASGSAVEHLLAKEGVAGSIPVSRSWKNKRYRKISLIFFETHPCLESSIVFVPLRSAQSRGPSDLVRRLALRCGLYRFFLHLASILCDLWHILKLKFVCWYQYRKTFPKVSLFREKRDAEITFLGHRYSGANFTIYLHVFLK